MTHAHYYVIMEPCSVLGISLFDSVCLNTQKYATEGDREKFLQSPNTSLNHRHECT